MEKNDEKVIVKVFPDGPCEVKGNFSLIGKMVRKFPITVLFIYAVVELPKTNRSAMEPIIR